MTAPRPLVILGAGGHASDVLAVVEAMNTRTPTWQILGVYDDREPADMRRFAGRAAFAGSISDASRSEAWFVSAVGYPEGRCSIAARAEESGLVAATLVHPSASISVGVVLGGGSVVFPLSHLSPMVQLGRHVLVSQGAMVGHDTRVGDGCSVMPGANISGDCVLDREVLVGTGASLVQGLRIGPRARIGAGAAVVGDVSAGATVVGVPARPV